MATTDQLILSSLPLPLARIFRDFDESIRDGLPKEDNNAKKKGGGILGLKKKKKIGALEGWVGELAMVYNMDQDVWNHGFNWGDIFYQRLVCTQQLLQEKFYQLYLDVFTQYTENNQTIKKEKRPRQSAVVCSLVPWLQMHRMDHDNALVGLKPSEELRAHFKNWWGDGKNDLSALARELDLQASSQAAASNQEIDPYLLYSSGYPARKGDLVVAKLDLNNEEVSMFLKRRTVALFEEEEQDEDKDYVIVIARISDVVTDPKDKYLRVWATPREDTMLLVRAANCVPLRELVKMTDRSGTTNIDLLMGNVNAMRQLVEGPFTAFRRYIDSEVARRARAYLSKKGINLEVLDMINKWARATDVELSFRDYYSIQTIRQQINALDPAEIKELGDQLQPWGAQKLSEFVRQLNSEPDASSNKFFVPTSATDLRDISTLAFSQLMKDTVAKYASNCEKAYAQQQDQTRELLRGMVKDELTKWWLKLIDLECEAFLIEHNYDTRAFDEGTYIDQPPANLDGVKKNLAFVQELLKPQGGEYSADHVVESLMKQIYDAIDDFILKARVVLSELVLSQRLDFDAPFDLKAARTRLNSRRDEMTSCADVESATLWRQLDGLIKDLEYLTEMKELELEQARKKKDPDREVGKLALTHVVPVSGLAMGYFFRLENVLKTVIELWDRPEPVEPSPEPAEPTPRSQSEIFSAPVLVSTSLALGDNGTRDDDDDDDDDDGPSTDPRRKKTGHSHVSINADNERPLSAPPQRRYADDTSPRNKKPLSVIIAAEAAKKSLTPEDPARKLTAPGTRPASSALSRTGGSSLSAPSTPTGASDRQSTPLASLPAVATAATPATPTTPQTPSAPVTPSRRPGSSLANLPPPPPRPLEESPSLPTAPPPAAATATATATVPLVPPPRPAGPPPGNRAKASASPGGDSSAPRPPKRTTTESSSPEHLPMPSAFLLNNIPAEPAPPPPAQAAPPAPARETSDPVPPTPPPRTPSTTTSISPASVVTPPPRPAGPPTGKRAIPVRPLPARPPNT